MNLEQVRTAPKFLFALIAYLTQRQSLLRRLVAIGDAARGSASELESGRPDAQGAVPGRTVTFPTVPARRPKAPMSSMSIRLWGAPIVYRKRSIRLFGGVRSTPSGLAR